MAILSLSDYTVWTPSNTLQLQFPASMGGCVLGSVEVHELPCRIACLTQRLPVAHMHLRKIFPDVPVARIMAAIPIQDAIKGVAALKAECQIELVVDGRIAEAEKQGRLLNHRSYQCGA